MRFDDRLSTVLAADMDSAVGAQAAWRQLVDLVGRGRVPADEAMLTRLRDLRPAVPVAVRAASARALAFATPDAALVALFAEDELAVAAPVLRTVTLPAEAWTTLLESSTPAARAVLRQRRDLPADAVRALESFGAVDFALSYDAPPEVAPAVLDAPVVLDAPPEPEPEPEVAAMPQPVLVPVAEPVTPLSPTPFVTLGAIARTLPVVAEALRRAEEPPAAGTGTFEIADLVARIDAFQRDRDTGPALPRAVEGEATSFRFETDAAGIIRLVDGVARGPLVGVSLALSAMQGVAQVDAAAAAAVRQRSRFADSRLEVGGTSDAAGGWRIAGAPAFDPATGRFTGYSGVARRPLRHETAAAVRQGASESLRQLVHELRTPANAVAGFAELIESQLLGPVPDLYRVRAGVIRGQAADLLAAIEDLDTAARLEGGALNLRASPVPLRPLLDRLAHELAPLAMQRGAMLAIEGAGVSAEADDRATERLIARLLSALLAAAGLGERIVATLHGEGALVSLVATRPRALADLTGDALFALGDTGDVGEGGPLLGAGFTLRLVRNLAMEMGGALSIGPDALTLRLPAAFDLPVEQASTS